MFHIKIPIKPQKLDTNEERTSSKMFYLKLTFCVFKEIFGMKRNSYQSTFNPAWYLALTKQGEAKSGPKTKPGQKAVGFIAG